MHLDAAKRLLAHEGSPADDRSGEIAAAERVYARLFDCLAPIIGPAGVLALFLRSAKLAQADHPDLGAFREVTSESALAGGIELFRSLSALDPALVAAATASVYARFLGLLTTLIGERLVAQILNKAFPELAATPTGERMMQDTVQIRALRSGVPGLDDVLGGGIPEFSLTLVAGGPGCGKTTLGHQIMFANAGPTCPVLYVSIIGEPPIKMLRYQQQFSFFDVSKVQNFIRFLHLGQEAQEGGLAKVLDCILNEVDSTNPRLVVVDSFRSMVKRTLDTPTGELQLQDFMQRLALNLTSARGGRRMPPRTGIRRVAPPTTGSLTTGPFCSDWTKPIDTR